MLHLVQVSRSIGDAYLKRPEFSLGPSFPRFHLPEGLQRPVLSAEPCVYTRVLQTSDKFVIFASDGLWEHVTNQQAVEIVHKHPRPVRPFKKIFILYLFWDLIDLNNTGNSQKAGEKSDEHSSEEERYNVR